MLQHPALAQILQPRHQTRRTHQAPSVRPTSFWSLLSYIFHLIKKDPLIQWLYGNAYHLPHKHRPTLSDHGGNACIHKSYANGPTSKYCMYRELPTMNTLLERKKHERLYNGMNIYTYIDRGFATTATTSALCYMDLSERVQLSVQHYVYEYVPFLKVSRINLCNILRS